MGLTGWPLVRPTLACYQEPITTLEMPCGLRYHRADILRGGIAQLVEHMTENHGVPGSIPGPATSLLLSLTTSLSKHPSPEPTPLFAA